MIEKSVWKILPLYLVLGALLLTVFYSCVEEGGFDEYPKVDIVYDDIDSLQFLWFKIDRSINQGIYRDIYFHEHLMDGHYYADIIEYKTDISSLKPKFLTNADHVLADNIEIKSGENILNFDSIIRFRLFTETGKHRDFIIELKNSSKQELPLMVIETYNKKKVENRTDWIKGRIIIDGQSSEFSNYEGEVEIKGRGNLTWEHPKKPYSIRLKNPSSILGMETETNWVLLANAFDKTLLRNRVALEIGKHTSLAWTPDSRYVNLILNGDFLGNYLVCEKIKIGESRVDIEELTYLDNDESLISGGYLLEFDRLHEKLDTYFRTETYDLPVGLRDPKILNQNQRNYITNHLNMVEEELARIPESNNYKNLVDIDSFIDWWIVNELTFNRDAAIPGSFYMYKDREGKLFAGPIWDFDYHTFNNLGSFILKYQSPWIAAMFEDETFVYRVKERWSEVKPFLDEVTQYIDAEKEHIRYSAEFDKAYWDIWEGPNGDEFMTWEDAIERMKLKYSARLSWMNSRINSW